MLFTYIFSGEFKSAHYWEMSTVVRCVLSRGFAVLIYLVITCSFVIVLNNTVNKNSQKKQFIKSNKMKQL